MTVAETIQAIATLIGLVGIVVILVGEMLSSRK
jgi:hypothetical protein